MRSERTSSGLQNPEPVPLEGKIYKCGLCSKMYGSTQDVETHFEVYHNIGENMPKSSEPVPLEVKFYKCGHCSKMYRSTQDIETHFEVYHNIGASIPKLSQHAFLNYKIKTFLLLFDKLYSVQFYFS